MHSHSKTKKTAVHRIIHCRRYSEPMKIGLVDLEVRPWSVFCVAVEVRGLSFLHRARVVVDGVGSEVGLSVVKASFPLGELMRLVRRRLREIRA
jgi:hypothetical protein